MSKLSAEERFWSKVTKGPNCWVWTSTKIYSGYGRFSIAGKKYLAHRLAYEWVKEPIPEGMEIDHLCRNRSCVNPDHLEPVTRVENMRRAKPYDYRRDWTHCRSGHAYDENNIRWKGNARICRACHREWAAAARRRKRVSVHGAV